MKVLLEDIEQHHSTGTRLERRPLELIKRLALIVHDQAWHIRSIERRMEALENRARALEPKIIGPGKRDPDAVLKKIKMSIKRPRRRKRTIKD